MQIFSTFENSGYLELAISLLEQKGIKKENIFAVPLDNRREERKLFDTLHRSDGVSLVDVAMALATGFSVIGASVGFILAWGPIFWGLIGAVSGFILGLGIKLFVLKVVKKKQNLLRRGKHSEVILIVDCEEEQAQLVEEILWEHLAIGLGKVNS
ncbi:hypothetical protein [Pseudalkalibacillus decolorationis]|uniref:hypothetical protein n=1 Tax=Pseudalkalibacillus decolorationis TaxID=163879 RepID=UPI0021477B42|nr:hypothetical protein [Pseudalkalibacillus decolorationis]